MPRSPQCGLDRQGSPLRVRDRKLPQRRGICLHAHRSAVRLDLEQTQVAEPTLIEQLKICQYLLDQVPTVTATLQQAGATAADMPTQHEEDSGMPPHQLVPEHFAVRLPVVE